MGGILLSLGPHRFEAEGIFYQKMSEDIEGRWTEHFTSGGGHIDQFLGADANPITISGVTFPIHYGGERALDGIKDTIKAGLPVPFYSANGTPFGTVKIIRFSKSRETIGPGDVTIEASYEITVSQYGGSTDRNPLTSGFGEIIRAIGSLF